jgi:alanyl-tRNA synthetase
LTAAQVEAAERLANDVVTQNLPVRIRFVSQEEAGGLGLRKLPPVERDKLRMIDIHEFDLTACGGTHVSGTGQVGCVLLRKTEKVRQGWRVEFVCGQRAIAAARRDYMALTETAGLLSIGMEEVPRQIQKLQEETRAWRKSREHLLGELADNFASRLLAETPETEGRKIIVRIFPDRDMSFIKVLAQRLTRQSPTVVALLGSALTEPVLVFAQSAGQPFDMGALMKEVLAQFGGRGGGSKDMAQGGVPGMEGVETVLAALMARTGG